MALTSPGVQVSVVDESFYTPAEPGTVPMIFVASAENKTNGAGTGIAPGTLKANAGRPYLLTSQRDLTETFGDPIFYTDNNNNPIHAGELNEYGLQAAYSLLGVSNRAFVVRSDVDLGALQASANPPAANPEDGQAWLDTQTTSWGIFEWNGNAATVPGGQSFAVKTPIVITDPTRLVGNQHGAAPKGSVGAIGDYAVVATATEGADMSSTDITVYYKTAGNAVGLAPGDWVEVGTSDWTKSNPTVVGEQVTTAVTDGASMTVNGETVTVDGTTLADVATAIIDTSIDGVTAAVVDSAIEIYNDGSVTTEVTIAEGTTLAADAGLAVGTYSVPALSIAPHTQVPQWKANDADRPTGSVWIKTTEPNQGARYRTFVFNGDTELFEAVDAPVYASNHSAIFNLDRAGGGVNLTFGDLYVRSNVYEMTPAIANFKIFTRAVTGATSVVSARISDQVAGGSYSFDIQESLTGQESLSTPVTVNLTAGGASGDADTIAEAVNSAGLANVVASVDGQNRVVISHNDGGEIRVVDTDGIFAAMGMTPFVDSTTGTPNLYHVPGTGTSTDPQELMISGWAPLGYEASNDAPTSLTADGALWYNSIVDEVDIMVHDGSTWVGYQNQYPESDPAGPIVSASEPTEQSDGTALVDGDLWISTADLENYPLIYKYNLVLEEWVLVDNGDQTTEDGVIFADARYGTNGANSDTAADISDLLTSDFLDPDAPDPALYPQGMLLFNLRRSGFNVKRFERNYINTVEDNPRFNNGEAMNSYYPHRWVTESGNQANGAGSFGRIAQRKVVVQQLQAMLNSNDDIRDDESRLFNLMATPGYPELIGEMITLNFDRGLSAFIVGDSPARLTPDATSLNEWATNVNLAVEDNDNGLVSRDEYLGVFYPHGFTSDNAGNNVVVPPSHMMLRTIALSDQVSYPWFAPAGTRRGGITNATATGFVDAEGEFVSIALNEGQRDTLYANNVNPITFISGAGLVNYGQKTRARGASALDRINVARLVIALRSQLNQLAKPYIFEPNDKITRDQIKQAAESLCLELVGSRALFDFLVVCDESNNTPARIDRNELYLDIAIEPVKAVEFVYIPLRLKNTGEIAGL
jgi:hypothetical protein